MTLTLPLIRRLIERRIAEAMADKAVVLLASPRHAGKTKLARLVAQTERRYLTLVVALTLLSAKAGRFSLIPLLLPSRSTRTVMQVSWP